MKGKLFKRIAAAALAAMMAATLSTAGVFAAAPTTIDPEATGSITIHKFENAKPGEKGDGTEIEDTAGLGNPMANIQFKVSKTTVDLMTQGSTVSSITPDAVTVDETFEAAGFTEGTKTVTTGADGTVKLEDLPIGVYKVVELANPAVTTKAADFLVSVPMTNPAGNGWMYNIHVYPKNTVDAAKDLAIEKTVNNVEDASVALNGAANWKAVAEIPDNFPATASKYEITDPIPDALTYTAGSAAVAVEGAELTKETDYTITEPTATSNVLKVAFTLDGLAKLAAHIEKQVVLTYTANITDLAKVEIGTSVDNTATVTYNAGLGLSDATDSDTASVYTSGLKAIKVGEDEVTPLVGALFTVTGPGNYSKLVPTGTDGLINLTGLKNGIYTLTETQAPEGYNLLAQPVQITVTKTSYGSGYNATIVNTKKNDGGFRLPLTGGMGTIAFTGAGLALIGGAAFLFARSRKGKKD